MIETSVRRIGGIAASCRRPFAAVNRASYARDIGSICQRQDATDTDAPDKSPGREIGTLYVEG